MEKISKNCFKGDLITNVYEIKTLALNKEAIYHNHWGIKPAAFYLGLQLSLVLTLIENKSIYKIVKEQK